MTKPAATPADTGSVITIDVPQLLRPADVTLATVGGSQYLLVSQYGTTQVLSVFGVNGAVLDTEVSDWSKY